MNSNAETFTQVSHYLSILSSIIYIIVLLAQFVPGMESIQQIFWSVLLFSGVGSLLAFMARSELGTATANEELYQRATSAMRRNLIYLGGTILVALFAVIIIFVT